MEDQEARLHAFAGPGVRKHSRPAQPDILWYAQTGVECQIAVGVEGRELPGLAVLPEEDLDIARGRGFVAAGSKAVAK